jgi:hypothetical protein
VNQGRLRRGAAWLAAAAIWLALGYAAARWLAW